MEIGHSEMKHKYIFACTPIKYKGVPVSNFWKVPMPNPSRQIETIHLHSVFMN